MVDLHPDKLDYAFVLRGPDLLVVKAHGSRGRVYAYGFISDEFRTFSVRDFCDVILDEDLCEESLLDLCDHGGFDNILARRKSSPFSVWKRLAQSRFARARWEVSCNPNAPFFLELLHDEDVRVRVGQLTRSNFPDEWIPLVWNEGCSEQKKALLEYHKDRIPPYLIRRI